MVDLSIAFCQRKNQRLLPQPPTHFFRVAQRQLWQQGLRQTHGPEEVGAQGHPSGLAGGLGWILELSMSTLYTYIMYI